MFLFAARVGKRNKVGHHMRIRHTVQVTKVRRPRQFYRRCMPQDQYLTGGRVCMLPAR